MKPVGTKPNLRNQQRIDVALEVLVSLHGGDDIACRITNLSRAGMMISCDSKTVKQLVPAQKSPAAGQWIEISAQFSVPVVAAQNVSIAAECHIIHLRRVSRDEFQLGLQFRSFEGNGHNYVDQYVSRQLSRLA